VANSIGSSKAIASFAAFSY